MFLFKQIVSALVAPATFALLLVAAGGVLALCKRVKAATYVLLCGALLAYLGSISLVGNALLVPLETRYRAFADDDPVPSAAFVVVLGSSYTPRGDVPVTAALDREGLPRIVEGIRLTKKLPAAVLIVSGGTPPAPPARGYAQLARQLGIDGSALIVHDTPLDTAGEARAVAARIGQEPFLLVTSAYHMPRAMRLMETVGARPIPAPTAHLAPPSLHVSWSDFLPTSAGMIKSERAVHEYVGLLALTLGIN
jgi:uncharacterized SAM-binding protein YcdF (DUF218 family)